MLRNVVFLTCITDESNLIYPMQLVYVQRAFRTSINSSWGIEI